jgi:hypothetical protein
VTILAGLSTLFPSERGLRGLNGSRRASRAMYLVQFCTGRAAKCREEGWEGTSMLARSSKLHPIIIMPG